MINLIYSILIAVAVFFLANLFFSWGASIAPALIAFIAAYLVFAQRAMKTVSALSEKAQREMQSQRVDKALQTFRSGLALGKKQFLVGPLMHANIGMLLYAKGDFEASRPHLEKGYARNYVAKAMLGCYHFRNRAYDQMKAAFEQAVKYGKKDGLMWSLYAYALVKAGQREEALRVLGRGTERNPTDERLRANLLALQNNKRMKMRSYGPQFYQFHLEPPPSDLGGGRRVVWQRR